MECKWEMNIFYLFSLGSKIKKAELNQRIMLACFLMVLGQLPLREIAPKPKTEPNTSLEAIIWILSLTIVAYFSSPL